MYSSIITLLSFNFFYLANSLIRDIFTIPFSKQKVEELTEYFSDTISFNIEERRSGRLYSCSIQEFRNMEYDELIDIKTGFADYWKSRQQQQQKGRD
jgi:hypothetical protein